MWLAWGAKDMRKPKTFGSGGKLERAHEKDVERERERGRSLRSRRQVRRHEGDESADAMMDDDGFQIRFSSPSTRFIHSQLLAINVTGNSVQSMRSLARSLARRRMNHRS